MVRLETDCLAGLMLDQQRILPDALNNTTATDLAAGNIRPDIDRGCRGLYLVRILTARRHFGQKWR